MSKQLNRNNTTKGEKISFFRKVRGGKEEEVGERASRLVMWRFKDLEVTAVLLMSLVPSFSLELRLLNKASA